MKTWMLWIGLGSMTIWACQPNETGKQSEKVFLDAHTDSVEVVENDFLFIPGERAGLLTADMSEVDLIRLLDDAVSPHDTIYTMEGDLVIGTILYKGTPDETHIIWKDPDQFRFPDWVGVGFGEPISQSRWKTNQGVRIGTALRELEKINGRAFDFWGFGWDMGGTASDWKGGLLQPDPETYFNVTLGYDYESNQQQELANSLLGDQIFSSALPEAQKLNPTVLTMSIRFRDRE